MGQFADQEIGSVLQVRQQILRGANITGSHKFEGWRIEAQAKRVKPAIAKLFDQRIQMRRRCYPNVYAVDVGVIAILPSLKLEFKRDKIRADIRGIQPDDQWLNQLFGQEDRERSLPADDPTGLDQHCQSTRMIGVSMGKNDRIQFDWLDPQLYQRPATRFAGIDQNLVLPSVQKKARVVTVWGRVPGGGPKESDRRHIRLSSSQRSGKQRHRQSLPKAANYRRSR